MLSRSRPSTWRLAATWTSGIVRHRPGRLAATALGVAVAVALLASIGAFLSASKATMTQRAIASVATDWQIEAQPGAKPGEVTDQVANAAHITASETVPFATVDGFEHASERTVQTTGTGQVLGISDTYRRTFPTQLRDLAGSHRGVLLFQQTAANLQAVPGSKVKILRPGLAPITVTIDGIVDLPQADSLFQDVGAPVGAQPQAPPDNVLLLPDTTWHRAFDPLAKQRPDLVRTQIHARVDHRLPRDPAAAYNAVTGRARNLEVKMAGTALVGDNLGATLAAARSDALYAQVLFLFLGVPGAVLAGLLTAVVADAGRDHRRRDQALLRARGATSRQLTHLGIAEAVLVAAVGAIAGLGIAIAVGHLAFGAASFGATTTATIAWSAAATAAGIAIAIATIAMPSWRDARSTTVSAARTTAGPSRSPRWMRWYADLLLVAAAGVVFWLTSRGGYKLVLAVEGVPTISVSYWAFAGPALLWIGFGLLTYRLTDLALHRGARPAASMLRPYAGGLAETVAATLRRQRPSTARGAALIALTIGFAASTAIFNSTYRQQAEVDAVLTNGADVTATLAPTADATTGTNLTKQIATIGGVHHVEAIQRRYAYVGADLQDLYGVNPRTITTAGRLQDTYFTGGTAQQLMATLAAKPDSVLVSAETVHDFQLRPGDALTLRLQDATTKQYTDVQFHYVGVAKEFPTAPSDSFLVANADYIARQSGTAAAGSLLIDTGGRSTERVRAQVQHLAGTNATVTDISTSRRIIGSSLTSVDLAGLTRVELGFALALAAAATGLTLWLGLAERRRTFAIATALGSNRRQLGAFVWAEATAVTVAGLAAGIVLSWALANMLVKVLQGVFDPPPSSLAIPWTYLAILGAVSLGATMIAVSLVLADARRPRIHLLRST